MDDRAGPPRLRLRVAPARGRAPLLLRFEAELLGEIEDPDAFGCPTLAWTTDSRDDGEVVIAQASGCREGELQRRYALEHAYLRARVYEASLRLVARDVPPSNLVQVLVEGPTPTPAARVALPGPTIVVATPGRMAEASGAATDAAGGAAGATDAAGGEGPATDASRNTPRSGAAAGGATPDEAPATAPEPSAVPPASASAGRRAARVLPADLYYLAGEPRGLWRIPAAGGPPEPLVEAREAGGEVEAYAVSRNRTLAFTAGGALRLALAEGGALRASAVLTRAAAADLLWSRDGRRLAFAAAGVWEYEPGSRRQQRLLEAGRPLAWSRDGRKLLARSASGSLVLIELGEEGPRSIELPIQGLRAAGFFPDRDVAWLAEEGGGLRLLSLGDDYRLKDIDTAPGGTVRSVFVRPDRKLLFLEAGSRLAETRLVDLEAKSLSAHAHGAPFAWHASDALAWAPDGRLAAAAGPGGLRLLDPGAGSEVRLVSGAAMAPAWVLSPR